MSDFCTKGRGRCGVNCLFRASKRWQPWLKSGVLAGREAASPVLAVFTQARGGVCWTLAFTSFPPMGNARRLQHRAQSLRVYVSAAYCVA